MTNEILYINHYLYTTFQKHKTIICAYVHAKSLQSCPALRNSMHCNPPGSSVHGILQAKILEWIAMPSSRGSSQPRDQTCASCSCYIAGGFFTTEPLGKPKTVTASICSMLHLVTAYIPGVFWLIDLKKNLPSQVLFFPTLPVKKVGSRWLSKFEFTHTKNREESRVCTII